MAGTVLKLTPEMHVWYCFVDTQYIDDRYCFEVDTRCT